jgi:MFS family permease
VSQPTSSIAAGESANNKSVKHPPPWLFVLTGMPYGVPASFAGSVMPYVTANVGIQVDAIGWYGTLLLVPPIVQFLYAPIIDVGPRRKYWLIIVATFGAACLLASCLMPLPQHTTAFLAFAVTGQLIGGLVGACNGGLMGSTMPDELRGKASGWYNVGNLSGGGLSATVVIWKVGHKLAPLAIGITLAAMMIIPSLAALWIVEPKRSKISRHDHRMSSDEARGRMVACRCRERERRRVRRAPGPPDRRRCRPPTPGGSRSPRRGSATGRRARRCATCAACSTPSR